MSSGTGSGVYRWEGASGASRALIAGEGAAAGGGGFAGAVSGFGSGASAAGAGAAGIAADPAAAGGADRGPARDVDDDAEGVLHREHAVGAQPVDLEHHPHAVGRVLPGPEAMEDAVIHDDRPAEPLLDERREQVDVQPGRRAAPRAVLEQVGVKIGLLVEVDDDARILGVRPVADAADTVEHRRRARRRGRRRRPGEGRPARLRHGNGLARGHRDDRGGGAAMIVGGWRGDDGLRRRRRGTPAWRRTGGAVGNGQEDRRCRRPRWLVRGGVGRKALELPLRLGRLVTSRRESRHVAKAQPRLRRVLEVVEVEIGDRQQRVVHQGALRGGLDEPLVVILGPIEIPLLSGPAEQQGQQLPGAHQGLVALARGGVFFEDPAVGLEHAGEILALPLGCGVGPQCRKRLLGLGEERG